MTMVKVLEKKTLTSDVTDKIVASRHVCHSLHSFSNNPTIPKKNTLIHSLARGLEEHS